MAMCTGLDRALGDLMQQLKAKGLAGNTIVVYTSDPEHRPLREKLHAQTLAWMKQFGDTGMTLKELAKRVMVAEDIGPDPGRGDGPFGQGRLKGRPLDVLSEKAP